MPGECGAQSQIKLYPRADSMDLTVIEVNGSLSCSDDMTKWMCQDLLLCVSTQIVLLLRSLSITKPCSFHFESLIALKSSLTDF